MSDRLLDAAAIATCRLPGVFCGAQLEVKNRRLPAARSGFEATGGAAANGRPSRADAQVPPNQTGVVLRIACSLRPSSTHWKWAVQDSRYDRSTGHCGVYQSTCVGQGRGVARRFSAFKCTVLVDSSQGEPISILMRVLPVGSGKLCVVSTTVNGVVMATPEPGGKPRLIVAAGRECP